MLKDSPIGGASVIAHARLDRCLKAFARRPALFAKNALRLSAALDARGCELEVSDPNLWRGTTGSARVAVERQFRADIQGVRPLERGEELRLAMRIEFAKLRLDQALPSMLCRRRLEWHALRMEMVERNLYLVPVNAARYRNTRADRSDMIQVAAASLLRAVDGFDWRRGVLFRTYAVHWLKQGLRGHLYNFSSIVRVPVYLQKSLKHVNAARELLGDPRASLEEVAHSMGLGSSMAASMSRAVRTTRSLDAPLDPFDRTRTLASQLPLPNDEGPYSLALEDVSIESGVEAVLEKLNTRERYVVQMRFGIGYSNGHSYSEVAKKLGVSVERVRQILMRALAKMRTPGLLKMLDPLVT